MRRLGAVVLAEATLAGCLLGPSADTSPEAAAEVYRASPAAFDSLRAMALEDVAGHVHLKARAEGYPPVERVVSFGRGPSTHDSTGSDGSPDRVARYRALLAEAGVEALTARRFRDGSHYVEVWVAASGIAVSGCTAHLVSGREPYEDGGAFYWHEVVGNGWFAEEACT